MKSRKPIILLVGLAVLVFGITFLVIFATQNVGRNPNDISEESAMQSLNKLYGKIRINTLPPIKGNVDLETVDMKEALPDISKYPPQVEGYTADCVEIFSSTEKAGTGSDGWLVDVAKAFNNGGFTVDGKPVSVTVRGIASGAGMDYISSGKYVPDAFSPSNELWGEALRAQGIKINLVETKLTGNVAGIVLSKKKHAEIIEKYGSVSIKTVTEAVANNELAMGYTNPFASSTGLNFLISTLYSFDDANPLSDTSIAAFESFQTNIPFVAYTTLQMKDSAKSGTLEGFVFEYQQFMNSPDLRTDYIFTPFGVRHDSPVYELGSLSGTKKEILRMFIEFCKSGQNQRLASDCGFNGEENYGFEISNIDGNVVSQAQRLWKEKKSGSRDIIAVFVADVSGSMDGEPLNRLKDSLLIGSKYIGNDCSVGLVTFSSDVNIALPIGKFDINQRSLFTGAVQNMQANGSTAMFDAIIVATKMLTDAKAANPNAKLMLFVLSDGETNAGHSLNATRKMIEGLKVPIYTIGYNANIDALGVISKINEAASINADTDDVIYKIQNLFNASM